MSDSDTTGLEVMFFGMFLLIYLGDHLGWAQFPDWLVWLAGVILVLYSITFVIGFVILLIVGSRLK